MCVFFLRVGNHAIRRNEDFKVAHVCVVGGEEDAVVTCYAGEDQVLCGEVREQ